MKTSLFAKMSGNAECRRPLLLRDMRQDALDHIWSRHIGNDPQPPDAMRADREINREHPAQALHPGHGCRGSVVVGFAVSFAQRMSADLRVAATPAAKCGWDNLASMPGVWGQYPVISDQVAAWPRHQRRQPRQEVQRVKHEVRGAIAVRCLQRVDG